MSSSSERSFLDKTEEALSTDRQNGQAPEYPMQPIQGAQDGPTPSKEYIQELTDIDLPDRLIYHIRIFLTPDWILSKLPEAGVWEIKWLARAATKRILAQYPRPDCPYPPEYQAEIYGVDIDDCFEPLTVEQRKQVLDIAELVYVRAARSEAGWQQDEMSKSLSVSRREEEGSQNSNGGIWSLIGK